MKTILIIVSLMLMSGCSFFMETDQTLIKYYKDNNINGWEIRDSIYFENRLRKNKYIYEQNKYHYISDLKEKK